MIIITAVLVLIVLINFYTIINLNKEKSFYKGEAITYGKRITGGDTVKISTALDRKWHEIQNKGGVK